MPFRICGWARPLKRNNILALKPLIKNSRKIFHFVSSELFMFDKFLKEEIDSILKLLTSFVIKIKKKHKSIHAHIHTYTTTHIHTFTQKTTHTHTLYLYTLSLSLRFILYLLNLFIRKTKKKKKNSAEILNFAWKGFILFIFSSLSSRPRKIGKEKKLFTRQAKPIVIWPIFGFPF